MKSTYESSYLKYRTVHESLFIILNPSPRGPARRGVREYISTLVKSPKLCSVPRVTSSFSRNILRRWANRPRLGAITAVVFQACGASQRVGMGPSCFMGAALVRYPVESGLELYLHSSNSLGPPANRAR